MTEIPGTVERLGPGEAFRMVVIGEPKPGGSKTAAPVMRRGPDGVARPVLGKTGRPVVALRPANRGTKPWMQEVAATAVHEWGPRDTFVLDCPLIVRYTFYVTRPYSHFGTGRNEGVLKDGAPLYPASGADLDKLERATSDALTGIIWRNDARLVDVRSRRRFGQPRCEIVVRRPWLRTVGEARTFLDEPLRDESQLALAGVA